MVQMIVVVVRNHDRIDLRERRERQPGRDVAPGPERGERARAVRQEWIGQDRPAGRPQEERGVAEPRERLRPRGLQLRPGLGGLNDMAGRHDRRAPIAGSAEEERRELGKPRGLKEASWEVFEPHAGRG